jgi:hypothetical protein
MSSLSKSLMGEAERDLRSELFSAQKFRVVCENHNGTVYFRQNGASPREGPKTRLAVDRGDEYLTVLPYRFKENQLPAQSRQKQPINSTIRPFSNNSWMIEIDPSGHQLGYLQDSNGAFSIIPEPYDSPLTGVSPGPWLSKEDAMEAIGEHLNGTCRMFVT